MSQRKGGIGRDPFAVMKEAAKPALAAVQDVSEVDLETITIKLAELDVDDAFNARTSYDEEEIEALAESIRKEGLLNPLTVRHRPHRQPAYFLVAGFKRARALLRLEVVSAPARLCRAEREQDAYLLNLAENTSGRSDLTAADIAQRCAWLSEQYVLSGAEIAERVKLSKQHVNNLIRLTRQLHPDLLEAFRSNHPSATVQRLVGLCSRSHEEQSKAWASLVRSDERTKVRLEDVPRDREPNAAEEAEEKGRARPTARIIQRAAEALESTSAPHGSADEWRSGFREALRWVLGEIDPPALGVDLTVKRGRPTAVTGDVAPAEQGGA